MTLVKVNDAPFEVQMVGRYFAKPVQALPFLRVEIRREPVQALLLGRDARARIGIVADVFVVLLG